MAMPLLAAQSWSVQGKIILNIWISHRMSKDFFQHSGGSRRSILLTVLNRSKVKIYMTEHQNLQKLQWTTGKNEGKWGHYQFPAVEGIDSSGWRQLITICLRLRTLAVQGRQCGNTKAVHPFCLRTREQGSGFMSQKKAGTCTSCCPDSFAGGWRAGRAFALIPKSQPAALAQSGVVICFLLLTASWYLTQEQSRRPLWLCKVRFHSWPAGLAH